MFVTEPRLAMVGAVALVAEGVVTPILQYRINLLTAERIVRLRRAGLDLIMSTEPGRHGALVPGLGEIRASYRLRLRMNVLKAVLKVARHVIERAATVVVLALGAVMIVNGETELGVVVAFLSGLRQVQGPWSELLDFYRRLADARVKYRLVRGAITAVLPGASLPGVSEARRVAQG